jgi:hypothetical protein
MVATNITGTALGLIAGSAVTNANLTGAVTSVGNATSLGSFTSAQLATALTDETGSGANVFATSPTLVTPILGTPQSGNFSTGTFTWPTFNQNTTGTASNVTGTVAIANGGTGQITANAAFNALAPSQTGNSGKYLTTDGTNTSWATNPLGTVTSVAATVPSFLSISGSPITTSGTLAFSLSGTALPTTSGGTGLTSFTSGGVVYASSTSALATGSALNFNGTSLAVGDTAASADGSTFYVYGNVPASTQLGIKIGGNANSYTQQAIRFYDTYFGAYAGYIGFTTNALTFGSGTTEGLRLTSSSLYTASGINVGIGTSSPSVKFEVIGAGQSVRVSADKSTSGIFEVLTSSSVVSLKANYWGSPVPMTFQTSETTQLTLSTSGNLGLGVTPSAWVSTKKAFQASNAGFVGQTDRFEIWSNGYYDGTNSKYTSTGYASLFQSVSGAFNFLTAASGTAGNPISFTQAMTLDASGRLIIGATTSGAASGVMQTISSSSAAYTQYNKGTSGGGIVGTEGTGLVFYSYTGSLGSETYTLRASIDSSGIFLVNATSAVVNSKESLGVIALDATGPAGSFKNSAGASSAAIECWNSATTGDNRFITFATDGYIVRGSITYNRAGGLTAYNVTSDYRAKDISGPVTGSGALIDSIPVYMGTMKGATQERPMFIAHETPAYAHTGEKDAVDANGNPVYQQMDASALIPVMWAEIQSLRQRLSAANL